MKRSILFTVISVVVLISAVMAVGEKPVVPVGSANLTFAPVGPVRANAVRNLHRAKLDGDFEMASALDASISLPSTEDVPMGTPSSTVVEPATAVRMRPADFGSDIFVAAGAFIEKNPRIATASTGEMFCVYEVEGGTVSDNPYLVVKKSTNGGTTWSPLVNLSNVSRNISRARIAIGEGAQDWVLIAFESRNTSDGDARVEFCKFAFDGTGATSLIVDGSSLISKYSPSICVEDFSLYNIYIGYIRSSLLRTDFYMAKSTDFGVTWTTQNIDASGAIETDVTCGGGWAVYAVTQTDDDNGDIRFIRSTDFGASWSAPLTVSTTHKDYFPQVAADGESTVVVVYAYAYSASDHDVYYSNSSNRGADFSTGNALSMSTYKETLPAITAGDEAIFAAFHRAGETRFARWNSDLSYFGLSKVVSDGATCEALAPDVVIIEGSPGSPCPGVVWTNRYTPTDFDIEFDSDCCPEPVADFSADTLSGDAPLTIHFTDESEGATSLDWDFGDGSAHSAATDPGHTYTDGGDFTVILTATNECGSDIETGVIHVTCPDVDASFTMLPSGSGDVPFIVNFGSTSTGGVSSYYWDFGDGSPSASGPNPVHTFDSVGVFTVAHIAANSCGKSDTATSLVRVYAVTEPVAAISPTDIDFDSVGVGGYAVRNVTISNTGTGMLWVYPDAITEPAFSFTSPDSFSVAPSDDYVLSVFFSPTAEIPYSTTLSFETNDDAHPILTVDLSGVGIASGVSDSVSVSPVEWDFDSVRVSECATRRVYVYNNSADTVWIDSLRIDGDPCFSFPSFAPEPIRPGGSIWHEMEFCPTVTGSFYGTMNVYTEVSSHAIPISGKGYSSSACTDYGDWTLCADILTSTRAEGHVTFLDSDDDTVLTLEEVGGIAFIDLSSNAGTGLCKFHNDDSSSITMMAGGFSLSTSSGKITSHPSLADINVLPDSLLKLPFDLDITVPPITIDIPAGWWKVRGVLKLKDSTTTIAEIGVARTAHANGDVSYELSDFGVTLFDGAFELLFEDVYISEDHDTIEAGRLKASISRHLVPKVSAWLEKDSSGYDSLHTGRGEWFKIDAKSLAIVEGQLKSLDVKFTIPDMKFLGEANPLTIKGVKGELGIRDGRLTKVAGEGKFGYKGLMPDWAGSGAYIRVSLAFNERGWDRVGLGYHGASPGVPLGTTGFFLTGVDGEVGHITAGIESLYVEFGCDLKGGPSLPLVGGIMTMTPSVYLDFGADIYRLDGDVRFIRNLVRGHGLLEYRSRDVGGGWGVRGEASITAGISSAVSIEGQIDAHVWTTHAGDGIHFVGHGGVTASLKHNAIFWLCPTSTISVGAHAYFGEFRLPSDMGGHWGAKGVLEWKPFGIEPQIAYIDGRFLVNSASEQYQPRTSRRFARPASPASVENIYDIVDSDINLFIARTSISESAEFTILRPGGTIITPDSCSTTDSLATCYYFEQTEDDGNHYMGYIVRGSEPGAWTASLDSLEAGDDSYGFQIKGFYNPKIASLTGTGTYLSMSGFGSTDSIRITRYIDRVRAGEFQNIGMVIDEHVYSPIDTSYTFASADPAALGLSEGEYYIYVMIQDNDGAIVLASDTIDLVVAPVDLVAPSAPTGAVATVSDSVIKAAWRMNDEPDLLGYRFYKGAFDLTMSIVWWDTVDVGDLPRTQILDWKWNIQDTVGIVFGVSAYDNSDNESAIAQFGLTGGFAGDYDITPPSIAFGTPTMDIPNGYVDIGWLCSDTDVRFYRLSVGLYDGDEMFVIDLPPDSVSYRVSSLNPGVTYHMGIIAVDSLLNMSVPDEMTVNFYDIADSDFDGLPDWWEIFYFGNIESYNGADDPDDDLLINLHEYTIGTAPNNADTDDDRIGDYYEYADTMLDPLSDIDEDGNRIPDDWEEFYFGGILPDPVASDADSDDLSDYNEFVFRTNPLIVDTDGGGASDGDEAQNHTDPTDPLDDNVEEFDVELSRGWNMVSVVGLPIDESAEAVFAGLDVYRYNTLSGIYEEPVIIDPGYGYFVLSMHDTTLTIPLYPDNDLTIPVYVGWNQIGSPSGGSQIFDPDDDPDGSVIPGAFGYDVSTYNYFTTGSLEEGCGYWIVSSRFAQLNLESGDVSSRFARPDFEEISDYGTPPEPPCTYIGERPIPTEIELIGVSPNPFNAKASVNFGLPKKMDIRITVEDILGRRVAVIADGTFDAGYHSVVWDGRDFAGEHSPSGVYMYNIHVDDRDLRGKMILIK